MTTTDLIVRHFDRVANSFDAIYSRQTGPLQRAWNWLTRQNIHTRVRFTFEALSPIIGKRILDVGCGSGRYAVELAAEGAEKVVGLDVSSKMIELARTLAAQSGQAQKCLFMSQNILDYETAEPFNEVIALGVFDYIVEPSRVLARIRALTKHQLVASFPSLYAFRTPFRRVWLAAHGCPVHYYTGRQIRTLCSKTGFACKSLVRSGPIYLLIAEPQVQAS